MQASQIGRKQYQFINHYQKHLSASGKTDAQRGVPVKIWLLPKNMLGLHDTLVQELSTIVIKNQRK